MRTISYRDPTGETAVGNILREERARKKRELREQRDSGFRRGQDALERASVRSRSA